MTYPFRRGDVYLIKFPVPDQPGKTITKYAVNLQEGKIIAKAPTMVCVMITTFKSSDKGRLYPTDVVLTPEESRTKYGAKVICNQIHTVAKSMIIDFKYRLSPETMCEIDERLLLGVGIVKIEDLEGES
jgi:mRNA-degrading endonuclease toxin of MazEF toxin-antitoxin module